MQLNSVYPSGNVDYTDSFLFVTLIPAETSLYS